MKILALPLGAFQTNCYIVAEEETGEALVFDPGSNGDELVAFIEKEGFKPKAVVLTHGHLDHIGGVQAIIDAFRIPVYMHEADVPMLTDPDLNRSILMPPHIVVKVDDLRLLNEGDTLTCGKLTFRVLETPGHTPGGICFYTDGFVIAGDTLFNGSIGRTDFPGGDYDTLIDAIRTKLYTLPDDTEVYPGHGPATQIAYEKTSNPFVR